MLKEALLSLESVAPTVMALGTKAGEKLHALLFSLPAATTTTTPALTAASMAFLYVDDVPGPPRLMLATAGFGPEVTTQSRDPVIHEVYPDPESLRTLHPWTMEAFATPSVEPEVVPPQCVPWPWASREQVVEEGLHVWRPLPLVASRVGTPRPPKSLWVARTPVSRM